MSKKLASGSKTIVLDVKVGAGAFMKTIDDARLLARAMLEIGANSGRNTRAVLTDMETPLGRMAGNALEVWEALETLHNRGETDLRDLCLALAEEALLAEGFAPTDALAMPHQALESGAALAKFRAFIAAQGGDISYVDDPTKLEIASGREVIAAAQNGFLERLDALSIGKAVLALGGGRSQKGEMIDHSVGVEMHAKIGAVLKTGEPVLTLYHNAGRGLEAAREVLRDAIGIASQPVQPKPLILERIAL